MLKGKNGVSACSLISCRIRAEALARAFNTRLWPCAWVTQRSSAERGDGMSNGIDDEEEFFDASPSPVEVEDESLFCQQHSSAATEAGRTKLYELLHQHATDDAIDVFYDVSEDAGLTDTCLTDGMKEPVQVDNFCQSSEYCRLSDESNILNDNLDNNFVTDKNSDIQLSEINSTSSSLKHETPCDIELKQCYAESQDISQTGLDPSIACCSSSVSCQKHELPLDEICDNNVSNENDASLLDNTDLYDHAKENSLMANSSDNVVDFIKDEISQNGEINTIISEQSDFQPLTCGNEAGVRNFADGENCLNTETPNSCSAVYDNSLSNENVVSLLDNTDSCDNGKENSLMAKSSDNVTDSIEGKISQNGEINAIITEQSDLQPLICGNEAGVINFADEENCLNAETPNSCSSPESKIDDRFLDITSNNPVPIAVIETTSPSPTSESPVIKSVPLLSGRLHVFEESRPKISRTTSLKTGKTPPGTPSRKKIVRFADVLGLDLEDVRHIMSGDVPIIPSSAYTDLDLKDIDLPTSEPISETIELKTRQTVCWKSLHGTTATNVLYPMFPIPGEQPDFSEKVRFQGICLENVVVSDMSVQCTCRVMNYGFHKKVTVRYSVNDWLSSNDIDALFVQGSSNGETDNFAFSIFLSPMNKNVKFALKYAVNGNEYWDNNKGQNYCFRYHGNDNIQQVTSSLWQHQFW